MREVVIEYRPTPRILAITFMVAVTIPAVVLLPLAELQQYFWVATIVTFVVGDSVTTGLLGRYGLEEQERGYTRWACGAEPSLTCAFLTRVILFSVAFATYAAIVTTGLGLQFQLVAVTVLTTPLILATGGFAATILNASGIIFAAKN